MGKLASVTQFAMGKLFDAWLFCALPSLGRGCQQNLCTMGSQEKKGPPRLTGPIVPPYALTLFHGRKILHFPTLHWELAAHSSQRNGHFGSSRRRPPQADVCLFRRLTARPSIFDYFSTDLSLRILAARRDYK